MYSKNSRWGCLTVLAACNLAFWLAVAVGVGLLASDRVDLGLESSFRAGQATVAVLWQRGPVTTDSQVAAGPTSPAPPSPTGKQARPAASDTGEAKPTPAPTRASLQPDFPPTMPPRLSVPPPPAPAPSSPPAAPPPLASDLLLWSDPDAASLTRLDAEMSRSAAGRPVQIRYSEAALNREIGALLAANPSLPYRDVRADLKRDGVVLNGQVTILGFQVKAQVAGRVVAQNCQPQVEIETISMAGPVTPGFVREGIQDLVLESLAWYPADHPLCLEQIVLEEERVTIYGSRR